MVRRVMAVLLALLVFIGSSCSTVEAISEDDVFVSEPIGRYVVKGTESYLSVNIKNFLPESRLWLVLSKRSDAVVDEVALKCELPVNQLMLVPPRGMAADRRVVYVKSRDLSFEKASEDVYDTVAKYFELKQAVEKIEKSDKYAIRIDEYAKLMSDYSYWQTKYMLLFERRILIDELVSPSYYVPLKDLETGEYVARFVDESGMLVKDVYIDIVEELPQLIPANDLMTKIK